MSAFPYDQLVNDSLHLPADKRGELAAALLKSLEAEAPAGQQRSVAEWNAELEQRSDEVHSGAAELTDAADSIAAAQARLNELRGS